MTKLLTALVAVFLCLPAYAQPNPRVGARTVLPWVVVDGDTVKRGKLRVRADNFDTPEMKSKCPAERALAQQATKTLSDLISPPHRFTMKYVKGHDQWGRPRAKFYSDGRRITFQDFPEGQAHFWTPAIGKQPWPGC